MAAAESIPVYTSLDKIYVGTKTILEQGLILHRTNSSVVKLKLVAGQDGTVLQMNFADISGDFQTTSLEPQEESSEYMNRHRFRG